jgi:hypothetical protein
MLVRAEMDLPVKHHGGVVCQGMRHHEVVYVHEYPIGSPAGYGVVSACSGIPSFKNKDGE